MAKFGAIVSRLAAIEDMAGMNMLCSDKTGTLTKNKMEIQEEAPCFQDGLFLFPSHLPSLPFPHPPLFLGLTQLDLLRLAALAAKWDTPPKDALDTLVLRCPLWWDELEKV